MPELTLRAGQAHAVVSAVGGDAPARADEAGRVTSGADEVGRADALLSEFLAAPRARAPLRSETARCALRLVDEVGMPLVVRVTTEAGLAAEALAGVILTRGGARDPRA